MEQRYLQQEELDSSITSPDSVLQQQNITDELTTDTDTSAIQALSAPPHVLTTLLQREAHIRRKRWTSVLPQLGVMGMLLWMTSRLFSDTDPASLFIHVGICLLLLMSVGWITCAQIAHRSYRRKRDLTNALAQVHDMKQVGALVQALRVENTPVRNLAKRALIELLPNLQASDAALLDTAERDILLRQLAISPGDRGYRDLMELFSRAAYRRELDFRLAILTALEQVGGAKELPAVIRLSRGAPTLHSASRVPAELQEAAKQCLPFLQARAAGQLASEQLLRASSADATSGDILLRPAKAQIDSATDQLLRAAEPNRIQH